MYGHKYWNKMWLPVQSMGTTANSVQDLQFLNMVKLYFLCLVNKNLYNFAVERVFSVDIYCYIVNLQIR